MMKRTDKTDIEITLRIAEMVLVNLRARFLREGTPESQSDVRKAYRRVRYWRNQLAQA